MPYRVVSIDLGAVTPPEGSELATAGQWIGELIVLNVAAGNSFQLAAGPSADWFTIAGPFTMEPDSADLANVGLRYRNLVAQPGATIEMILVYGKAGRLGAQAL